MLLDSISLEHKILGFPNAISVRHFPEYPLNFETCIHQDVSSEGPKVGPRLVLIQNSTAVIRDIVFLMAAKILYSVKLCGVLTPDVMNSCCPLINVFVVKEAKIMRQARSCFRLVLSRSAVIFGRRGAFPENPVRDYFYFPLSLLTIAPSLIETN